MYGFVKLSYLFISYLYILGYYRVNYDTENWRIISRYLQNKHRILNIHTSNRAQLLDDALNLARSGYLDYNTALDVTKYLYQEFAYVPWKAAINNLQFIDGQMESEPEYYKFKVHLISNIQNFSL